MSTPAQARPGRSPARYSTVRTPAAVATVKRGRGDQAGVDRRLGQAADAVAAHLGRAPSALRSSIESVGAPGPARPG